MRKTDVVSPLANRTYRNLFSAQVIALAGTGFTSIALALLAYDLAGENAGAILGTALALKMVAYIFIAPIAGAYAHRFQRRRLLIGLDIARAALVLFLPFVTEIWQIYLLIFLLNMFSAGFTPTFQATIPDILPNEAQYTRALSLSRLAYDLENLLSPALASLALLMVSYNALFGVNAIAFLVSAALVLSVQVPNAQHKSVKQGLFDNLTYGIRAYLKTPRLQALLALSFAVAGAGAMMIVNTVVYVRDVLGGTEFEVAIVMAASGAGSMLVALSLPRLLDRHADKPFMLSGGLLLGVGLAFGMMMPDYAFLIVLWFVLGVGSSLIQTVGGRLVRRSCAPEDRPAFYAAQFALSHACWLLAYPLAGWLGSVFNLSLTFIVLALLVVAATGIAALSWKVKPLAP